MDFSKLFLDLVLYLVPLIIAISVHEFSHVAMARFLGDDTGTRMGRFTLHPLRHIDPLWTVALPATLMIMSSLSGGGMPVFAAGKPAPYNPMRLDRKFNGKRISIRTGELLVAAAGPVSNLVLAFLSVSALFIFVRSDMTIDGPFSPISLAGRFLTLNVGLFVFNLIPVHPLDGSKVLSSILPRDLARKFEQVSEQLGLIMFGILIFFGASLLGRMVDFVVNLLLRLFF